MPQMEWINPASSTYQARRWANRRRQQVDPIASRVSTNPTPDPGSQTENVRVDPSIPNVVFVTTSVQQPVDWPALILYPSSIVRPDPANPAIAWLTVTETGP